MTIEAQFVGVPPANELLGAAETAEPAVRLGFAPRTHSVLAVVGMSFEAKIAAAPGVPVFTRSTRRELESAVESAAQRGYRGIISFGVAGGLAMGLQPGDWVVASAIVGSDSPHGTDRAWSRRILDAIGEARYGPIIGVDAPVAQPAVKRELHRTTGAVAVDMESHLVARLAAAHGLAFTALRVIVDPAHRAIPSAALMGMGAGARADGRAVLRDLAARPSQLWHLLRVSMDAFVARSEMVRVRRLLGPHFGLGELPALEPAPVELETSPLTAGEVAP